MALWNERNEDLTSKTGTREAIKENGVYELEIAEAYITNSGSSKAVGLCFNLQNDEHRMRATFWYKKGDGEPNEFAERQLNRLLFLCNTTVGKLKTETKQVKGFNGGEFPRTFVTNLTGKKIGVITEVTAEQDGDNIRYNYNVKDFYSIKTGKTSDEISNDAEAKTVDFFRNKYSKEAPTRPQTQPQTNINGDDDEFPF